jgi:HK97 family phage portal protein
MLERLRAGVANAIDVMALAITTGVRRPGANRVPNPGRTVAGVVVTPDNVVTLPAVWRAISFLSQTVGVLPWHVMLDGKNGAEVVKTHSVDWLLYKRPSAEWSSFQFRETLTHWACRWGNGYAEIEPDQLGRPFALWPIHPERVQVCRALETEFDAYGEVIKVGDLYYEVQQEIGGRVMLSAKRMFHIRGFGEGPVGVNVVQYAAQSLGWAKAVQLFGASFFGNGANIAQVVINKKPLKPGGLARQKAEFDQLYKGPTRSNKTAHLDNDADIKSLGLDAEKSQLNQSSQAQVVDICRWFGVPPHKVMDLSQAHFNNLEQQNTEVVVDSISPWVKRFEDEADYKLFGADNRRGYYSKINMRALMRGDVTARIAYYEGMVRIGAYSPNRVLELEDENTIGPEGDIHVMQSQNVTLKNILEGDNQPLRVPGSPDTAEPPAPPPDDASAMARLDVLMEMETARV